MPFFSIIIPTRNRPAVVAEAVSSVLAQDFDDIEILVIDDGSDRRLSLEELNIESSPGKKLKIVHLDNQPSGRGPSYTRNVGIRSSTGDYCAFLDDDDAWLKNDHLSAAYRAITGNSEDVDLYLSNQEAFTAANGSTRNLWLYALVRDLVDEGRPMHNGCYRVVVEELIATGGFSHLNTTIASRDLLRELSGLDENLGYEEDLDFYLRAIDAATTILFCPDIVARHNVPDPSQRSNVSTLLNQLNRLSVRLYILNKNMVGASNRCIADYCEDAWVETLRLMVHKSVEEGNYTLAHRLSKRAIGTDFSLKWVLYGCYLFVRSILK